LIVPIEGLARPGGLEQALNDWAHVVEIGSGETFRRGGFLSVLPRTPSLASWHDVFCRDEAVPPLKCYFLKHLAVCGDGFLYRGAGLVTQESYLSRIAIQWAERAYADKTPDELYSRREIDEKVIMAIGPGWQVFGHWLLDFLPRLVVARWTLGAAFDDFKIVLPVDSPDFVADMLAFFLNVPASRLIYYDRATEKLFLSRACVPDYAHYEYCLHSEILKFYRGFIGKARRPHRLVCLTRRRVEATTRSLARIFEERALFDAMAADRGFELVCPEELSLAAQIRLQAETWVQIGEHGSAQHMSIFAGPRSVMGMVNPLGNAQLYLARQGGHKLVMVMADRQWQDERGVIHFTLAAPHISGFLDEVEAMSLLD